MTQNLIFSTLCRQQFGDSEICDQSKSDGSASQNHGSNSSSYHYISKNDSEILKSVQEKEVMMYMGWNVLYTSLSIIIGQIFGYWMDR